MANRPRSQARLLSFEGARPDDDPEILEALGLLSLLADRAMVAGADPSASVSPDHALLMLCDYLVIAKRQHDELWSAYRKKTSGHDKREYEEMHRAERTVRSLLLKIRKFSATTPAGLFAKAAAVSRTGSAAGVVALSLADDLLASPELRRAVWPVIDRE
jgi:hypothetical protein